MLGVALAGLARAQQPAYGQCGGIGYSGSTACVSGYTCVYQNDWYSQCLPGGATQSTTLVTATKTSSTSTPTSTGGSGSGKFKWFGVNQSGAEFGTGIFPGLYGKEFIFPDENAMQTLINQGYNIFRIPFSMERLAAGGLTSSFDQVYLTNLTKTVNFVTGKGAWAVIDPHNFGRYNGAIITDTTGFGTFWKNLATAFKSNAKAIFDTNNEYHDEDQTLVLNLNQAAINAIRAAGATSQYIFVEGNSWSGAWTWNVTNTNLAALTDPQNKIVYEMHQYLDSDGSGTSADCVSSTIGAQRVSGATAWLRQNGKLGVLGEFAGGANSQCQQAVLGMLDHMQANSDVWTGALWWGGGPWWGTYIYGYEPPSGVAYTYYNSALVKYTP